MNLVKRFVKDSSIYSLQPLLQKLISFVLIPIYTAYLTPADYGILQYIITYGAFFYAFIGMGLSTSFWKFKSSTENYDDREVFFNIILSQVFIGIALLLIILIVTYVFASSSIVALFILLYFISQIIRVFYNNSLLLLRANFEANKYIAASSINIVILLLLNILFVKYFRMNYRGIIYSYLITYSISSLMFLYYLIKHIKISINTSLVKKMLSYGFPLMIGNIMAIIISLSDRFFLKLLTDDTTLGLYSFGYKFGDLIQAFLVQPFFLAWNPLRWEIYERKNGQHIFSKFNHLLLSFFPIITIFIIIFAVLCGNIITINKVYLNGFYILSIIAYSNVFFAFYYFNTMGLLFTKKTKYITLIVVNAGMLNLILNYIFIPKYNMFGAAIATLMSYFLMYILSRYFCQKYYPIQRNNIKEAIQIVLIGIMIYYSTLTMTLIKNIYIYSALQFLFGLFYIVLYRILNLFDFKEIKNIILKLRTEP